MIKRKCASSLLAIAISGLAGCESTDFNWPGKNIDQTSMKQSSSSHQFDDAQLAGARLEGAGVIDNKMFTIQANSDSRLEIEMAKLADQKSSDLLVRRFAARIIQEHQKTSDQIKMLAQARNYVMAEVLLPEEQKSFDNLSSAVAGGDFDRQFLESQINALQETIQLYQGGSSQLTDNELRAFAAQTLPTLQDQLQTARDNLRNLGTTVR